jgi:hypothetical protein
MQDIFTETNAKDILKPKEIRRLGRLIKQRVKNVNVSPKMLGLVNLLAFGLYLPSVRKALKIALAQIRFDKFQHTNASRYFSLTWSTYDFFGESAEVRKARYMEIHKDIKPTMVKVS